MKLGEYIKTIKPGESVLIEHTSLSPYPVLFYAIGHVYGWERVLIVDAIDSVLPILRWLRLSGIQIPDDINRIQAGGTSNWGNILLKIDPYKDPEIFLSKFTKKLKEHYSKSVKTITMILNPERVVSIHNNNRELVLILANLAVSFIGNHRRITFYFVNSEITDKAYLALLEEAFTRVIIIKDNGDILITKSPYMEEEGTKLEIR